MARQSLGVGKEGDVFAVFPMNDQKALGPDVAINWKRDGPLTWTKWPTIVNLRQTCEKAELPPPGNHAYGKCVCELSNYDLK